MNLLALDTASEACSVGVAAGARRVFLTEVVGRGHQERLFTMIREAMAEAGASFAALDRIAVTVGPGSFAGVRVGVAAARGLALATGKPAVGVGALDALARSARDMAGRAPVLAAIDARRGEVFFRLFADDGAPAGAPSAATPADLAGLARDPSVRLAGSGAELVAAAAGGDAAARIVHRLQSPEIGAVVALGLAAPAPDGPPAPLYIRPPDAKPQAAATVLAP